MLEFDSSGSSCIDAGVFIEDESIPDAFELYTPLDVTMMIDLDVLDTRVPGTRLVLYVPMSCNVRFESIVQSFLVPRNKVQTSELLDPFTLGTTRVFSPMDPQAPVLSIRETRLRMDSGDVFESVYLSFDTANVVLKWKAQGQNCAKAGLYEPIGQKFKQLMQTKGVKFIEIEEDEYLLQIDSSQSLYHLFIPKGCWLRHIRLVS